MCAHLIKEAINVCVDRSDWVLKNNIIEKYSRYEFVYFLKIKYQIILYIYSFTHILQGTNSYIFLKLNINMYDMIHIIAYDTSIALFMLYVCVMLFSLLHRFSTTRNAV